MTLALPSRLTLVYTAVFGLLLTGLGVVAHRVLAHQLDADVTANLAELTSGLHGYLRFDRGEPTLSFDAADTGQAAFVREATRYFQIFDADTGHLLVQSEALRSMGLQFTATEVQALRASPRLRDFQTDDGRIRLSTSLVSPGSGQTYLLQIGASLDGMDRALDRFLVLLLVGVPAGLVVAFLAGRRMAGIALAPLSRLAAAAGTIDITDLQQRLPVRGTRDELDAVALAFNDTLGRLERAVGEMRQFSAALAHELRTPLAALRGEIEMVLLQPRSRDDLGRRLASQLEEIDKLKRLIDQLLTLARAEAGEIPIARGAVDLGAIMASLVEKLELVAQAKGITLQRQVDHQVVVAGDAQWLERLLLNLVDNAIKFTPEHGCVDIRVSREGEVARLDVRDTGVGMTPEVAARVFERFFRADSARSSGGVGVGLGLSLAKWIVDRHNGRIGVESEPGQGSTFTVHLPLAPR